MRNCSRFVSLLIVLCSLAISAQGRTHKNENMSSEKRVEEKSIPSSVRYEVSREVGGGRIVKLRDGSPGHIRRTYAVKFRNGEPVAKQLISEERVEPTPTVFRIGKAGYGTSRGNFVRHGVKTMLATAYYSMVCGTGRTRTGERATFGVVAVDPRVIRLGSMVYVEGYGLAKACDTGGAIKGNRIDLCFESPSKVAHFNTRRLRVHILN